MCVFLPLIHPTLILHYVHSCYTKQILKYLDKHVIGQEHAKKVLAVSVYNHFCRLRAVKEARQAATRQAHLDHLTQAHLASATAKLVVPPGSISINDLPGVIPEKSNVLLIGPSGCGKTLLAKTVSRLLRVPFAMGDATGLTEAGYVGEDVDSILFRLLEAADFNLELAQSGIVFLDEVDKIAKAAPGPKGAPSSGGGGRDVGGEGVQHALLKMLEGTVVQVADRRRTAGRDYIQMDTSNLLFILSGAFVGLEGIVARRLQEAAANCGKIGFAAVVGGGGDAEGVSTGAILSSSSVSTSADAKANASADGNPDANTNTNTHTNTNTSTNTHTNNNTNRHPNNTTTATPSPDSWMNNLLIEDVITYGLIPEFIGRVPVLAVLEELDQDALVRTLTEPKNALIKQYQHLFAMHNICLSFTPEALIEIGAMAVKAKTGARGLRGILEKLLLPMMYEMPGREDVREVCIDAEYVRGERREPVIILK